MKRWNVRANADPAARRAWVVLLSLGITLLAFVEYAPAITMGFVADDFDHVANIHFALQEAARRGDAGMALAAFVYASLTDIGNHTPQIRPVVQALFWMDYALARLMPAGYHFTNILLLILTSVGVAALVWNLSQSRVAACLAGLIFVVMPIHAEAVAWIGARHHLVGGTAMALCAALYTRNLRRGSVALALVAFLVALLSYEVALIMPWLLLGLEVISRQSRWSNRRAWLPRLAPFFLLAVLYLIVRIVLFHGFGTPPYTRRNGFSALNVFAAYSEYAFDPLTYNISIEAALTLDVLFVVLILLYRERRMVLLGAFWLVSTIAPLSVLPVGERYFYVPSIGVALVLTGILVDPFPRNQLVSRWARVGLLAALVVGYCLALYERADNWHNAGMSAARILEQLKALHPTLESKSVLIFQGLPQGLRRAKVFAVGIGDAVALAYDDPTLTAQTMDDFAPLPPNARHVLLFEYENKKLTERQDLVDSLTRRQQCSAAHPVLRWQFDQDAQGWEAWNEIEAFGVEDGALGLASQGSDPFMGSPLLNVPTNVVKQIEIKMRAQSQTNSLHAELYWQTLGMKDFSPDARTAFDIIADAQIHTYVFVPLFPRGTTLLRLRLDPADTPAEIAIYSIELVCQF